jgi:glycosyltransferase involved in cell wall biosynthesis
LEYLSAGLPVVATSVGAEGIEDDNLMCRDDPREFAEAIIRLFRSE